MNIHKNARTTPQSRALLVHRVVQEHWPVSAVAIAFGVSQRTVYKWLARYRAEGLPGLVDRCSRAHRRPHALAPAWISLIRLLRQAKLVASEIAARVPVPRSTVSAVLARLGLGRLRYLNPAPPVPSENSCLPPLATVPEAISPVDWPPTSEIDQATPSPQASWPSITRPVTRTLPAIGLFHVTPTPLLGAG